MVRLWSAMARVMAWRIPPGGVGGELVAAGVLELVHRPHQSRVPLLDEVQEAQAAVAVALGDGDDQPQVAGGEVPLGAFVLGGAGGDAGDAAAEGGRALQRDPHEVAEFRAEFLAPAGRFAAAAQLGHLAADVLHPPANLLQVVQGGLQAPGPQGEFFHQPHGPAPPAHQPLPSRSAPLAAAVLADGNQEVLAVAAHDVVQRVYVGTQQLQQPPLLAEVDHRDLDGAIQPRAAVANALQQAHRRLQHVIRRQHVVAETLAAALDVPGQDHLLLAVEHGNFAHLHQVDADRIVDLGVVAGLLFRGIFRLGGQFLVGLGLQVDQVVVHEVGPFRLDGAVVWLLRGRGGVPAAGNSPPEGGRS